MMHTQINRAITSALAERVIPEIQNNVSSLSSSGRRYTESGFSPDNEEVREDTNKFKSKTTKKDCKKRIEEATVTAVLTVRYFVEKFLMSPEGLPFSFFSKIYIRIDV